MNTRLLHDTFNALCLAVIVASAAFLASSPSVPTVTNTYHVTPPHACPVSAPASAAVSPTVIHKHVHHYHRERTVILNMEAPGCRANND